MPKLGPLTVSRQGYGAGHNEILLGKAIADRRAGLVIASKFVHRPGGSDALPVRARDAVEASLSRLGLDHIDLYYLHRIDPDIPVEESVGELGRLVDEGKIGAVGVSEASADQLRRAHRTHPIAALQSEYSLWTRRSWAALASDRPIARMRPASTSRESSPTDSSTGMSGSMRCR